MSDAALVQRCLTGSPAAARELVERFQGDVLAVCRRLLGSEHDSEDVAQEVFVRVFRSLARWDSGRPLRPWVLGITVNRCRTWIGKRARGPELADYLHEAPDRRPADDSAELATELRAAVDDLRTDYREVFVLFHEHGHPYEFIAAAVGRPVGTIKTWLHRARLEILDRLRSRGLVPNEEQPPAPAVRGEEC
ncbi:RNA polymerase sigma factor [Gemmata sp. JC717]|uniref:RNA polymerase sigma factor n=1 Tax=Gemmata algarum TaxID=2975278 RepID=A0ABU5EY25_9BACT|nr:RNA polymerase sigma factor [Gemmata algarum]MDY3551812.1 RNA polymerase sigma factor [Gemmata algarum]MDY3560211.1 RNA polymerase sigma factor [Gemmata algarum]